jgi:anaerobic sulfite reductase subunit C
LKRCKVIAEVVDAGHCQYYKKGRKFVLGGFTPSGLCDGTYTVLSRDSQTMRYGAKLPWERNGVVLTRCPDPDGALWQLKIEEGLDSEQGGQQEKEAAKSCSELGDVYEHKVCRGMKGGCPFSLVGVSALSEDIKQMVKDSAWVSTAVKQESSDLGHYCRFKVTLAACPNACTQPQIKDIGIIANVIPRRIGVDCNGCRSCEEVCQEEAIAVRNGVPELLPERCVGCGACIKNCPQEAIESEGVQFRILVGGRMGRHPRWGQELCVVDGSSVARVVEGFLDKTAQQAEPGDRLATVVERIEVTRLREEIFSGV